MPDQKMMRTRIVALIVCTIGFGTIAIPAEKPKSIEDWSRVHLITAAMDGLFEKYKESNRSRFVPRPVAIIYVRNHLVPGRMVLLEGDEVNPTMFRISATTESVVFEEIGADLSFGQFSLLLKTILENVKQRKAPNQDGFESLSIYVKSDEGVIEETILFPSTSPEFESLLQDLMYPGEANE